MKAAILVEQNKPLVVDDVPLPRLAAGQVLVRVHASGICGKQIDEVTGKRGDDPYLPHLLGHEGAGVVEDVGPGVRKVKPGDHVVLHWMKASGTDSAPPRYSWRGRELSAGWVTTFSDQTIVSENRVTVIPDDFDLHVAPLLGCAVTTGLGIVFNNAQLKPGQSIAVFGVGGVGLNVIQGAALANAYPLIAIDLFDNKLDQARAFGATHVVNARTQDVGEILKELSRGVGLDATVDTTGDPGVIQTAYGATSNKGRTILAGVPHHTARITIDSFPLHFGRRIFGSHGGETVPDQDIGRYIQLYKLGKLKLNELITHRLPLDDVNQAIDTVRRGEAGRCLLNMA
jgi:S-(hydroxymethyl)glutathione dehydrogenase / alcohol dehydrogenase